MAITWDDIRHHAKWISRRETYVQLSFVMLFILLGTIINDLIHFTVTERMDLTTQSFTMGLLFLHDMAFYLALLGFVYTTQATYDTGTTANWAALAILGHAVVFILRVVLEVYILQYREELYT